MEGEFSSFLMVRNLMGNLWPILLRAMALFTPSKANKSTVDGPIIKKLDDLYPIFDQAS